MIMLNVLDVVASPIPNVGPELIQRLPLLMKWLVSDVSDLKLTNADSEINQSTGTANSSRIK